MDEATSKALEARLELARTAANRLTELTRAQEILERPDLCALQIQLTVEDESPRGMVMCQFKNCPPSTWQPVIPLRNHEGLERLIRLSLLEQIQTARNEAKEDYDAA